MNSTSEYWQTAQGAIQLQKLQTEFVDLYTRGRIPLTVVLPSLVLVLHDYLVTVGDEVRYVWTQKPSTGRTMFFFIRYYTILLLIFDVVQIHSFAIKGVPNKQLCVIIDPVTRLVGAISLWTVEIIMQLRIYALFDCSKKVAWYNGIFFLCSVVLFIVFMIFNATKRGAMIQHAMIFPLPGCPTINGGPQWILWIPATVFELNLFGFVIYKTIKDAPQQIKLNNRAPLLHVLLHDNIIYFLGITVVLILNNLMTIRETGIPWFSFGPFHAALGIMTCRMHIHLRKASLHEDDFEQKSLPSIFFRQSLDLGEYSDSERMSDEESAVDTIIV